LKVDDDGLLRVRDAGGVDRPKAAATQPNPRRLRSVHPSGFARLARIIHEGPVVGRGGPAEAERMPPTRPSSPLRGCGRSTTPKSRA